MKPLLVYLDTNIFSRVTDLAMSSETAHAYNRVANVPELSLVTSLKTKQEMERTPNETRASVLLFLFSVFAKVPWSTAERSGAYNSVGYNVCAYNSSWVHPVLVKLRAIFDRDDADHIFQAAQAGCDYFLTLDERTILSKVREHEALLESLCPQLKFRSPIELATEIAPDA